MADLAAENQRLRGKSACIIVTHDGQEVSSEALVVYSYVKTGHPESWSAGDNVQFMQSSEQIGVQGMCGCCR